MTTVWCHVCMVCKAFVHLVWWDTHSVFTLISGIEPLNLFSRSVPPTSLMICGFLSPCILDHHGMCLADVYIFSSSTSEFWSDDIITL